MIVSRTNTKRSNNSDQEINTTEINWPDSDVILPTSDRTRLFSPEIVYESPYTFDTLKKRLLKQSLNNSFEQYDLALIECALFPFANGKREHYFYKGVTGMTRMLDLSTIVQLSHKENGNLFWLLATANWEFNSRGCNLYSNLSIRDLSVSEDFAWQLEKIVLRIGLEELHHAESSPLRIYFGSNTK
jgi:hypothetical protein